METFLKDIEVRILQKFGSDFSVIDYELEANRLIDELDIEDEEKNILRARFAERAKIIEEQRKTSQVIQQMAREAFEESKDGKREGSVFDAVDEDIAVIEEEINQMIERDEDMRRIFAFLDYLDDDAF